MEEDAKVVVKEEKLGNFLMEKIQIRHCLSGGGEDYSMWVNPNSPDRTRPRTYSHCPAKGTPKFVILSKFLHINITSSQP